MIVQADMSYQILNSLLELFSVNVPTLPLLYSVLLLRLCRLRATCDMGCHDWPMNRSGLFEEDGTFFFPQDNRLSHALLHIIADAEILALIFGAYHVHGPSGSISDGNGIAASGD